MKFLPMRPRFDFDGALKELFQQDRPTLLRRLSRGVAIKEFLNVELPKVQQRRVDLLIALTDATLLHIEFQSTHDRHIGYRIMEYRALIKRRYLLPLRQVVLFVGRGAARVPDRIEEDGVIFPYEVLDIREIDAEELIKTGNPGDLALAVLAGGGDARLSEILQRAARLKGARRERLLVKILVLSGLRGVKEKVEWELKSMPVTIDIDEIPVLRHMWRDAESKGRAAGRAEGEARGKAEVLEELLETKFGRVPRWASARITAAKPAQVERWVKKIFVAKTLEGVLGPRHRNGS